jgi:hypothetical protein
MFVWPLEAKGIQFLASGEIAQGAGVAMQYDES